MTINSGDEFLLSSPACLAPVKRLPPLRNRVGGSRSAKINSAGHNSGNSAIIVFGKRNNYNARYARRGGRGSLAVS